MGDPALSGDAVAWLALAHKQWLGDLADRPVRVGQISTGESNAVISQVGAACQVYPFPRRGTQEGEAPRGWLRVEVAGEGIAEASAGGCEVVGGEGGDVGGRHDARGGDQRTVGR